MDGSFSISKQRNPRYNAGSIGADIIRPDKNVSSYGSRISQEFVIYLNQRIFDFLCNKRPRNPSI